MSRKSIKRTLGTPALAIANSLLSLVSLKLVPTGTPTRSFSDFFRHLKKRGMSFRSVVDVGVAFGSPALYKSWPGAKFFLVEPVPQCRPLLEKLARSLDAETFGVAAGAEDGEIEFFVHPDISGSSRYRQWEGEFLDGESQCVPMRRLDSLIPGPLARPSLLKIDTQGAELEVLAGAGRLLEQIDMLIVEVSLHQFRKDAPEFNQIVIALAGRGFECYEVLEGHYRAVDDALAQVDLVFVPVGSPLRAYRGFFSPEQAHGYLGR